MPNPPPVARQVLRELAAQDSAEAAAVADCLRNIAANVPDEDPDHDPDAYLTTCAQEIAQHALAAALRLNPQADEHVIHWSLGVADVQELFRVDAAAAAAFLRDHQYEILEHLDAKARQLLRDYGEIDELPLVDDEPD